MSNNDCPSCGKAEGIQRVSALVEDDEHKGGSLARMLAKPARPPVPQKLSWWGQFLSLLDTGDLEVARERTKKQYQEKLNKYANVSMPEWNRWMNRWHAMYYCHSCNVVYIPGQFPRMQPPERAQDLCKYDG